MLAELNAILWFLARHAYLPDDLFAQAKVLQWLSFEGDYVQSTWRRCAMVARRRDAGRIEASGLVEVPRRSRSPSGESAYLAGDAYTIADISVFAYVHRADEADLPLADYRNIAAGSIASARNRTSLPSSFRIPSIRTPPRTALSHFGRWPVELRENPESLGCWDWRRVA